MHTFISTIRALGFPACLLGVCVASAGAAERRDKTDAQILDELESSTAIEFTDVPLQDCLDYLADFHELSIAIDEQGLAEVKVTRETPFT